MYCQGGKTDPYFSSAFFLIFVTDPLGRLGSAEVEQGLHYKLYMTYTGSVYPDISLLIATI